MDSRTACLGSTWLVLAMTLCLGAQPSPAGPWPHDAPFRPPYVTAIAFSADGKQIAAAYFVNALNRPGTDWSSQLRQPAAAMRSWRTIMPACARRGSRRRRRPVLPR